MVSRPEHTNFIMHWYRETAILSFFLTLCLFLYAILSYLSNTIYTQTFGYLQAQQQIQQLSIKNNQLYLRLLEYESYTKIASVAASEGFRPEVQIVP